jgi:hypothetical protein
VFFLNDVPFKKLLSPCFHLVRKDFIKNFEPTVDSKRSAAYVYIDPAFLLDYLHTFNFLVYIVPLILPMIRLLSMPESSLVSTTACSCHAFKYAKESTE